LSKDPISKVYASCAVISSLVHPCEICTHSDEKHEQTPISPRKNRTDFCAKASRIYLLVQGLKKLSQRTVRSDGAGSISKLIRFTLFLHATTECCQTAKKDPCLYSDREQLRSRLRGCSKTKFNSNPFPAQALMYHQPKARWA